MKVVVFGQESIGYYVPDRLYKRFDKARREVGNFDHLNEDDIPKLEEYFKIKEEIILCKFFFIDDILTGNE